MEFVIYIFIIIYNIYSLYSINLASIRRFFSGYSGYCGGLGSLLRKTYLFQMGKIAYSEFQPSPAEDCLCGLVDFMLLKYFKIFYDRI